MAGGRWQGAAIVVAFVVTPQAQQQQQQQNAPAVTNAPGIPGWAYPVPIAGRSPSYLVRQMLDFQKGNRNGPGAKLMKPVVANVTMQDMVAIAAYVSSRSPEPSKSTTTARR